MKFNIYRATNDQYYFTGKGGNNEVIFTSETYVRKASAQHAINIIKGHAANAMVIDLT